MFRVIGGSAIVAMLVGMVLVAGTLARGNDGADGADAASLQSSPPDPSAYSSHPDAAQLRPEEFGGPGAPRSRFALKDKGFGFVDLGPESGDSDPDAQTDPEAQPSDGPVAETSEDAPSPVTTVGPAERSRDSSVDADARTDQRSGEPIRSLPSATPSRPGADDGEEPSRDSKRTPDVRELMKRHPGARAVLGERTRTPDGGIMLTQLRLEDGRDSGGGRSAPGGLTIGGSPSSGGAGQSASDTLKAGEGCSIQCIKSGIAYARGVGAKLEVKTDTPAQIWIVVWNDNGYHKMVDSGNTKVMTFSHTFSDLQPGKTYQAMAVAQDSKGYASHGYGSFHTLVRNVEISVIHAQVIKKPYDSDKFYGHVRVQGKWGDQFMAWGPPGTDSPLLSLGLNYYTIQNVDQHLDLAVQLLQWSPSSLCAGQAFSGGPFETLIGAGNCNVWATAVLADGDNNLDAGLATAPGATSHTLERTLKLPGGGALPPGYGQPMDFTVPVTLYVTYTE